MQTLTLAQKQAALPTVQRAGSGPSASHWRVVSRARRRFV